MYVSFDSVTYSVSSIRHAERSHRLTGNITGRKLPRTKKGVYRFSSFVSSILSFSVNQRKLDTTSLDNEKRIKN